MMEDGITHKVLQKFKDSLVVRKSELIDLVRNEIKNPEDPRSVIDMITKMLVQKGWITPLYASESTFAITQRGMKA
jgi:hypothetical protein